jgi:hypothetical protein
MAELRTKGFTDKPRNPSNSVGKKFRTVPAYAALLTASMVNGDILTLAGPLTFGERIARVVTLNASPALTSATDAKLGFFMRNPSDGTLKLIKAGSDALLWNGVTLAASLSTRDLLTSLNSALNQSLNIGELLQMGADQEPAGGVFLGLTFPTKPSVNGTLDLEVWIEEATTN